MTTRSPSYAPSRLMAAIFGMVAILLGLGLGAFLVRWPDATQATLIVLGMIAGLVAVARLEFGFLVLIFITYVRLSDNLITYYNAPSIAKPFVGLLFAAVLVRALLTGGLPRGWLRPAILVGLYGLIVFSSLFYAEDFAIASTALDDYFKDGIIAILVVLLLQNMNNARHAVWTLLVAGIFMGSITTFQYLTGTFENIYWGFGQGQMQNIVGETEGYRIAGVIGDPNFYAQILVVLVPLAFDRLWNEKSMLLKLLAAWALTVSLLSVIFTFSRGGFVALVIVLLALAIYRPPRPLEIAVLIILAMSVLPFVPAKYMDRLQTLTSLAGPNADVRTEVSFRGRASELLAATRMFADRPLLGVGVGNYSVYYQRYSREIGLDPRTEARAAHNLFLEIASETGIIGFSVFLLILWAVFNGLLKSWRMLSAADLKQDANLLAAFAIGMLGYLSAAMFIHGAYPRYLWLLVGIALGLQEAAHNRLSDYHEPTD